MKVSILRSQQLIFWIHMYNRSCNGRYRHLFHLLVLHTPTIIFFLDVTLTSAYSGSTYWDTWNVRSYYITAHGGSHRSIVIVSVFIATSFIFKTSSLIMFAVSKVAACGSLMMWRGGSILLFRGWISVIRPTRLSPSTFAIRICNAISTDTLLWITGKSRLLPPKHTEEALLYVVDFWCPTASVSTRRPSWAACYWKRGVNCPSVKLEITRCIPQDQTVVQKLG